VCWVVPIAAIVQSIRAGELTDVRHSPFAKVQAVRLDEVRWADGFWADRFETCRTRSVPAMWEIMKGSEYKPFLENFRIAAGLAEGDHHGAQWNDGDFYKWLEAACAVLAVADDPQLEQVVENAIEVIGQAQREDGYIHTPVLIRQRNGESQVQAFQDRHNFEMYNMGHLMTAACLHHRVTGRDDFLNIAKKTADLLCETFREPTPELAKNSVCPSHYMGAVELYRTTGEPRYLKLARTFIDMRHLVEGGGDDNQDRIPFTQQREAVGHAVRANYLYAGATDLYAETGDARLWNTLDAIWHNVVETKMYITGGCGALYDGASPDGSRQQGEITRVHQAYGRNYQLPNTTAHSETCANIGNVLWNWRMFLVTGEARFMDVVELALYNSVLSGVSWEGTDYFYVNPLRNTDPLPTELRWSRTRVPFVTSYCCPPNVVRTIAEVNGYVYSKTDDAVWVNLYGGSTLATTLDGEPLRLTQATDYPWDGRVRSTIDECPGDAFALKLRIPGWAERAIIRVNGDELDTKLTPATYAEVRRMWNPGDVVELELEMPAQLIESHPLVEELKNQVAVKRGPIVYCLESLDLPEGVRVEDVLVPASTRFATRYDDDLLDGVTVLEANVLAKQASDWSGALYRPVQQRELNEIAVGFIPYYAWANRGAAEMSVWLPVERD
jgi:DUF1680 family protein